MIDDKKDEKGNDDKELALQENSTNIPKLNTKGILNIKGNKAVTYDSALDYAHQKGIEALIVELCQIPSDANGQMAVCLATLFMEDGTMFQDIGDATPQNTPAGCRDSLLRMASTRAKNRVLHDACNIAAALAELDKGSALDTEEVTVSRSEYLPAGESPFAPAHATKSPSPRNAISDKQMSFITSLASGHGKQADDAAMERFGKPLDALNAKEADAMIKGLQGK